MKKILEFTLMTLVVVLAASCSKISLTQEEPYATSKDHLLPADEGIYPIHISTNISPAYFSMPGAPADGLRKHSAEEVEDGVYELMLEVPENKGKRKSWGFIKVMDAPASNVSTIVLETVELFQKGKAD